MAPDTQQNLLYTIYFVILHNYEAIFYSAGIIFFTLWLFWRPNRSKLIIMWGFIILLFAFEYNKHILEPLRQQTLNSLVTERKSARIEHYINKFTTRILPRGLPLLGWILIISGGIIQLKEVKKKGLKES